MSERRALFKGILRIRPNKSKEFAAWNTQYVEQLSHFPGLSLTEIGATSYGDGTWEARLAFDSPDLLQEWLGSTQHANLMAEVESLALGSMVSQISIGEHSSVGVTEVILSQVLPGCEQAFKEWQAKVNKCQSSFEGYLGAALQPPLAGQDQWTTLLRFDKESNLKRWLNSEQRREMLRLEEGLVQSRQHHRLASAFPGWISEPPAASKPPADWKTSMLIVLGLFPIVMLQMRFLNPILAGIPLSLATLMGNIVVTLFITYLTMPLSVRAFGWWLFETEETPNWSNAAGATAILLLYLLEVAIFWNLLPA